MATSTSNLVHDNSSLANFKAWAQFISNAFSAFGWVQTADTGQVNWSTIASVPSSTYVYEIWRMNDTLQATCPVYVKMEYGFSTTNVQFRFSVGQGSDGSGNLTTASVVLGPFQSSGSTGNNGAATYPCFGSGDSASIRFCMWQGVTQSVCFGFERSKTSAGANDGRYATVIGGTANSNLFAWVFAHQLAGNPNPTPNWVNSAGWVAPAVSSSLNFNGETAAIPIVPFIGQPDNPMLDWVGAYSADIAEGALVTVSIYGSNHTYLATKEGRLNQFSGPVNGYGILLRYE